MDPRRAEAIRVAVEQIDRHPDEYSTKAAQDAMLDSLIREHGLKAKIPGRKLVTMLTAPRYRELIGRATNGFLASEPAQGSKIAHVFEKGSRALQQQFLDRIGYEGVSASGTSDTASDAEGSLNNSKAPTRAGAADARDEQFGMQTVQPGAPSGAQAPLQHTRNLDCSAVDVGQSRLTDAAQPPTVRETPPADSKRKRDPDEDGIELQNKRTKPTISLKTVQKRKASVEDVNDSPSKRTDIRSESEESLIVTSMPKSDTSVANLSDEMPSKGKQLETKTRAEESTTKRKADSVDDASHPKKLTKLDKNSESIKANATKSTGIAGSSMDKAPSKGKQPMRANSAGGSSPKRKADTANDHGHPRKSTKLDKNPEGIDADAAQSQRTANDVPVKRPDSVMEAKRLGPGEEQDRLLERLNERPGVPQAKDIIRIEVLQGGRFSEHFPKLQRDIFAMAINLLRETGVELDARADWPRNPPEDLALIFRQVFGEDWKVEAFQQCQEEWFTNVEIIQACVAAGVYKIFAEEALPWPGPKERIADLGNFESLLDVALQDASE